MKTLYLLSREELKTIAKGEIVTLNGGEQIGCSDPVITRSPTKPGIKLITRQFPCDHCSRSFKTKMGKGVHEARAHK